MPICCWTFLNNTTPIGPVMTFLLSYLALSLLATVIFCRMMAVLPRDD